MIFFVPLGITSSLTTLTHSFFNAAIASLPSPEVYLSAFTVAKSLLHVIQNPVGMVRQAVTALVTNSESYHKIKYRIFLLATLVFLLFVVFVFTGGASWTFKNIMGLKGKVLEAASIIIKVFIFFPLVITLRNFFQGIAIKFSRTPIVTVATVARVIFVASIAMLAGKIDFIPPGVFAGLLFLGAASIEAFTVFTGVKIHTKSIPRKLDEVLKDKPNVDVKEITNRLFLSFMGPLILTSLIRSLSKPIIDSGLARTTSPEIAISAYAVAWGLGIIIVSPLMMFHQVPLHFIDSEGNNEYQRKSVKKFAKYLSIILALIIIIMSFTSIGVYIMKNFIGVSEKIVVLAIDVLKIMSLLPIVRVIRQYYWGIFMLKHKTKYLSNGKIVNLIALSSAIFIVTLSNPANPEIIGITGMIVGEAFESGYLSWVNSRL
jgi:hypothetical protein